jgi:iron complex outermembrane receptor protein
MNASQKRYLALDHTETATSGYVLFNMYGIMEIHYGRHASLQFELAANNLFNKAYQSSLSRLKYFEYYTASPKGRLGIYNMGRNICVKIMATF